MTAGRYRLLSLSANGDWLLCGGNSRRQTQTVTVPVPVETTEEDRKLCDSDNRGSGDKQNEEKREEPEPSALHMNMAGYSRWGGWSRCHLNSLCQVRHLRSFQKGCQLDQRNLQKDLQKNTGRGRSINWKKSGSGRNSTDYWKDVVTKFVDGDGTPISGYPMPSRFCH